MTVLLGNHDHNAIDDEQGPLRTDDVSHLEWKAAYGGELPEDLRTWIATWPRELALEGCTSRTSARWPSTTPTTRASTSRTAVAGSTRSATPSRARRTASGIYGHTPVRGGVNIASQGRAILLDTNGHGEEYAYLEIEVAPAGYRLRMRGLFFDELITRPPASDEPARGRARRRPDRRGGGGRPPGGARPRA
jgi:hypothetical protein